MFTFLFRRSSPLTLTERQIYRYWNGQHERGIDPILALRTLSTHPDCKIDQDAVRAFEGDPAGMAITISAIREVFGIAPWQEESDGTQVGLTEAETLALLDDFSLYVEALKKNTSPSPTGPASMGPAGSQPWPTPEPNTSASSDSGSSSTEPRPAEPLAI